jgi:hypothetical protein
MIVTRGLTNRYGNMVAVDGLSFNVSPGVAVDRQSNALSVTIGVVRMLVYCVVALGLGAVLLDRRDA